jgi:hypothetical protein
VIGEKWLVIDEVMLPRAFDGNREWTVMDANERPSERTTGSAQKQFEQKVTEETERSDTGP